MMKTLKWPLLAGIPLLFIVLSWVIACKACGLFPLREFIAGWMLAALNGTAAICQNYIVLRLRVPRPLLGLFLHGFRFLLVLCLAVVLFRRMDGHGIFITFFFSGFFAFKLSEIIFLAFDGESTMPRPAAGAPETSRGKSE